MPTATTGHFSLQYGNIGFGSRRAARAVYYIFVILLALVAATSTAAAAEIRFERSELTVVTAKGPVRFDVELATDDRQRAQGLQHRKAMAADAGMLFLFPEPQVVDMWMKNTHLSLDMIFIRRDGHIVSIAEATKPLSLDIVSSGAQASAVLEVLAGTAKRLGIVPGDRVIHPLLGRR